MIGIPKDVRVWVFTDRPGYSFRGVGALEAALGEDFGVETVVLGALDDVLEERVDVDDLDLDRRVGGRVRVCYRSQSCPQLGRVGQQEIVVRWARGAAEGKQVEVGVAGE